MACWVPSGLSKEVVDKVHSAVRQDPWPCLVKKRTRNGLHYRNNTPEQFTAQIVAGVR